MALLVDCGIYSYISYTEQFHVNEYEEYVIGEEEGGAIHSITNCCTVESVWYTESLTFHHILNVYVLITAFYLFNQLAIIMLPEA